VHMSAERSSRIRICARSALAIPPTDAGSRKFRRYLPSRRNAIEPQAFACSDPGERSPLRTMSAPAAGKRRRLKPTRPRRPWVEPEQLPALLDATSAPKPLLAERGRPLLDARGRGPADRGGPYARAAPPKPRQRHPRSRRLEDGRGHPGRGSDSCAPRGACALARPLALQGPSDLVFPTAKGRRDNRQNVRRRLLLPAVERANVKLASLGIEPIWRRHTRSPARSAAQTKTPR
jgi:hypothetical protein